MPFGVPPFFTPPIDNHGCSVRVEKIAPKINGKYDYFSKINLILTLINSHHDGIDICIINRYIYY